MILLGIVQHVKNTCVMREMKVIASFCTIEHNSSVYYLYSWTVFSPIGSFKYGQPPHGKKGPVWDGPVTLKNADLWQWFLSQQINKTSGKANHHMDKRGMWDGQVILKNTDLWKWLLSQQINRTWGQNGHS